MSRTEYQPGEESSIPATARPAAKFAAEESRRRERITR